MAALLIRIEYETDRLAAATKTTSVWER